MPKIGTAHDWIFELSLESASSRWVIETLNLEYTEREAGDWGHNVVTRIQICPSINDVHFTVCPKFIHIDKLNGEFWVHRTSPQSLTPGNYGPCHMDVSPISDGTRASGPRGL
jgi:hypothetical protein